MEWYLSGGEGTLCSVGLTSTPSLDSGTSFLERVWTLFYAEVVPGERWIAGMDISIAPSLSARVLKFSHC